MEPTPAPFGAAAPVTPPSPPPAPAAVPGVIVKMPDVAMTEDLARSGLLPTDMQTTAIAMAAGLNSYTIPYWNADGTQHTHMARVRNLPTVPPVFPVAKYDQASKDAMQKAGCAPFDWSYPYLPPLRALFGPQTPLWSDFAQSRGPVEHFLVEGEKKAVSVCKHLRLLAIGIGGCFQAVIQRDGAMHYELHPALAEIYQRGDTVNIVFDGDLTTNRNVNYAGGTLRRVLLTMGIKVRFILLPRGGGGVDDWIMAQGTNNPNLRALFDALPTHDGVGLLESTVSMAYYFGIGHSVRPSGKLHAEEQVVAAFMQKHERYSGHIWLDNLRATLMQNVGGGAPKEADDIFIGQTLGELQYHFQLLKPGTVKMVVGHMMPNFDTRDPVQDYLTSLRWDGVPRVDEAFIIGWGAFDDEHTRAVGRNFFLGMVGRAMEPGVKHDLVLVLEGKQGIGKSRSLAILGGEWYAAIHEDIGSKDFKVACHRTWLADMDELSSMQKREAQHAKSIASTPADTFRMPYASTATERKRHFVLAGTTNEGNYLTDTTGNRRYMPIRCTAIDVQWITANRDQLFAEALERFTSGEPFWNLPALSLAEQAARLQIDPWLDVVTAVIEQTLAAATPRGPVFIAASTLFWHVGIPVGQQTSGIGRRMRGVMEAFPAFRYVQYRPRVPYPVKQANGSEVLSMAPMRGYLYEPTQGTP